MHLRFLRPTLFACFSSLLILLATTVSALPPLPYPTPSPPVPVVSPPVKVDSRPSATFTFTDATQIKTRSATGRFRLVSLHLNETVDVAVQLPAGVLGNSVTAQSLDGGKLISVSLSPTPTGGVASVRFQAGNRPGLYRVLVPGLGMSPQLKFWVANPSSPNPRMAAVLLNPNH